MCMSLEIYRSNYKTGRKPPYFSCSRMCMFHLFFDNSTSTGHQVSVDYPGTHQEGILALHI
jgi:hypothetical protein